MEDLEFDFLPLTQTKNSTCLCGSGKKYKRCCMMTQNHEDYDVKVAHIRNMFTMFMMKEECWDELKMVYSDEEISSLTQDFVRKHAHEILGAKPPVN